VFPSPPPAPEKLTLDLADRVLRHALDPGVRSAVGGDPEADDGDSLADLRAGLGQRHGLDAAHGLAEHDDRDIEGGQHLVRVARVGRQLDRAQGLAADGEGR